MLYPKELPGENLAISCRALPTSLTNTIYKTWAGMTAREYKQFKGLKKENLRDNMTNMELILSMLSAVGS